MQSKFSLILHDSDIISQSVIWNGQSICMYMYNTSIAHRIGNPLRRTSEHIAIIYFRIFTAFCLFLNLKKYDMFLSYHTYSYIRYITMHFLNKFSLDNNLILVHRKLAQKLITLEDLINLHKGSILLRNIVHVAVYKIFRKIFRVNLSAFSLFKFKRSQVIKGTIFSLLILKKNCDRCSLYYLRYKIVYNPRLTKKDRPGFV